MKLPDISKLAWQLNIALAGAIFSVFALIYNEKYIFYGLITFVFGLISHFTSTWFEFVFNGDVQRDKRKSFFYVQTLLIIIWLSLLSISGSWKWIFNWNDWLNNFSANLISDLLIAVFVGLVISKYIENRERRNNFKEKLRLIVNMLWSEIEHNRKQLKLMLKELPQMNLPYPALEMSTWNVIDKNIVFDGLNIKDIANILDIYNRVDTINMTYYSMLNKINWIEDTHNKPVIKKEFFEQLIQRCQELLEYINKVLPEPGKIKRDEANAL